MTTTPDTTAKAKTMRELRAEQEPVYATTPTLPGFTMLLPAALDTTPVSEFHGAAYRRTQAERLRKTADGMTRTIEAKANPAVAQQRATHRRTKMTKHMKEESRRLLAKQRTLQALAAAWDDGTLPRALATITSRAALEALTHDTHPDTWPYPSSSYANEYRNKLTRLGIINQDYLASVNGLLRHYRRTTDDVITPEEAAAERLWARSAWYGR